MQLMQQAQIAGGFLPLAFVDSLWTKQFPEVLHDANGEDRFWSTLRLLELLRPGVAFASLPWLGTFMAAPSGGASQIAGFLCAGFMLMTAGQLIMIAAADVRTDMTGMEEAQARQQGVQQWAFVFAAVLVSVASTLVKLCLRYCAADLSTGSGRLISSMMTAAMVENFGRYLGKLSAWSSWGHQGYFVELAGQACRPQDACFDLRVNMAISLIFTLMAMSLSCRAHRGDREKKWRLPSRNGFASDADDEFHDRTAAETLLRNDPGTVAAIMAAFLSFAAWRSLERANTHEEVLSVEIFPGELLGARRWAETFQVLVTVPVALGTPRLMRTFGAFGVWLSTNLLLAALLLCSAMVRTASPEVKTFWLALFGPVPVLLCTVPYVVVTRRARARNAPVIVGIALVCAVDSLAQIVWFFLGSDLKSLLGGSEVTLLAVGAACAVWSAVVCSHAIACDRDSTCESPKRRKRETGKT